MSWWGRASTTVLVLCLVGCGGGEGGGSSGSGDDAAETQQTTPAPVPEETDEPSVEPTGPEKPQQPENKPDIRNAKLPVGGTIEFNEKGRACFSPGWNGGPLPEGVQIKVSRYELTNTDVVRFGSGSCPDGPRCVEGSAFGGDSGSCFLLLQKVSPGETVLNIFGNLYCASDAACAEVEQEGKQAGGLTITITEDEVEPPPDSPSTEETTAPEETAPPEETAAPEETPSPAGTDG